MLLLLALAAGQAHPESVRTPWSLLAADPGCPLLPALEVAEASHAPGGDSLTPALHALCDAWELAAASPELGPTPPGAVLAEQALSDLAAAGSGTGLDPADTDFLLGFGAWLSGDEEGVRVSLRRAVAWDEPGLWRVEALLLLADHEACGCGCIATPAVWSGP